MNILTSKVDYHPETFAPVVTAVIEFPLDIVVANEYPLSDNELATIIGTEFISAWKRHKGAQQ